MNPLELRDIHLPEASLWWPPAPGWWLLLLVLIVLTALMPWVLKRLRQKPLRSTSLYELQQIRAAFVAGQNENSIVAETSALLRRIMISYHGREGYAASTGADWLEQLKNVSPQPAFNSEQLALLARDRYRRDCECDVDGLLQACERWIQSLPRSRTHVPD